MAHRWTNDDYVAYLAKLKSPLHVAVDTSSKRGPKYGNRKVTDPSGVVHDSGKEYRRWCELELREKAGEIRNLRRQVPLACVVEGSLICHYICDAMYEEGAATIVEDCKSPQTRKLPVYRLKIKLVQALHKLQVREI